MQHQTRATVFDLGLSNRSSTAAALSRQGRIIFGILLLDMRTRFGKSYASYLIAIAWPLTHMGFLLLGYVLTNRVAPIGDDPTIFIATGLLPYILCFYPARMMALSILQNIQLLNIPIVTPFQVIIARATLECLSAIIVCILFFFVIYISGVGVTPSDPIEAAAAILMAIYLGICLGFFNVVAVAVVGPFYVIIFVLCMIGAYITCGIFIPSSLVPNSVLELMQYNPLFHLVNWLRHAYYDSTAGQEIDKLYVGLVGSCFLFVGLVGERFLRGKIRHI